MEKIRILLSLVLLIILTGICWADKGVDLVQENAQLKQRVDKLEKEVEELKKLVMQQAQVKVTPVTQPAAPVAEKPVEPNAAPPKLSEADMQKIMAMLEKEPTKKKLVWADLDIQLYGYIKADASYDSSRTTTGNYALYLNSEATNKNDDEFNLTANQTRFGIRINGPDDGVTKSSGLVEIDFYGNGAAENKPEPMMRHGYLNIEWPKDRFSILAGQTSDVISPLWPDTLNYTVMWDVGNIGYRRPQIRLTKSCAVNKEVDLKFEAAATRTIGRNDLTGSESGEDAGYPTLQARTSVTFPWCGYKPTTIGISGHVGREEYDINSSGSNRKFESWSANLDVLQPVTKDLTIKGELFTGENLGNYFGGIGQGVSTVPGSPTAFDKEIRVKGGWIAATLGPYDKWRFNLGTGIDDVDRDDIDAGERSLNRTIFGNAIYSINKNTEVGLELSHWRTDYKGPGDAESVRAQTSFIYKF